MSPKPTPNDLTRQQLDELDVLLQRMLSLPAAGGPAVLPPAPAFDLPPLPLGLPGGWRADAGDPTARSPYSVDDLVPSIVPLARAAVEEPEPDAPPADEPSYGPVALDRSVEAAEVDPRRFAPPTPDTGVPPSTATVRGADAPALPPGFQLALASPPVDADVSALVEHAISPAAAAPASPPDVLTPADLLFPPAATAPVAEPPVPVLLWPLFAVNWVLEGVAGLFGPLGPAVRHPAGKHLLGWCGVLLIAAAGAWSARGIGWVSLPFPR